VVKLVFYNYFNVKNVYNNMSSKDRKLLEFKLRSRLDFLHVYAAQLDLTRNYYEIAETSLSFMEDILHASRASFQLMEGDRLVTILTDPITPLSEMPMDGPGVTVKVARERRSILISDVRESADYVFGGLEALSELAVPVVLNDKTIAVLNVESSELSAFDEYDQELLETFSSHVAAAVARIRARVTQRELDSERIQLEEAKDSGEVKNLFISTVIHELQTPITAIKGFVQLISLKVDELSADTIKMLEIVARNSSRLEELTDRLLDFQRIESRRLVLSSELCDINQVIRDSVEELGAKFREKNQSVVLDLGDVPEAVFDRDRMCQVLINLLGNADKYSVGGTKVTVHSYVDDNSIYVSVEDEGIGISEADMGKLFQPFYRVDRVPVVKGTGLGLSISKGIVELHGGRLWAESEGENMGSRFIFTIPVSM
jgi:signal transduction histidine kinase